MKTLEARDLVKTYASGGKAVHAVRGVSFAIEPGEIFAFLGPNGAGKTTTIKMIAGLVEPSAGSVRILGEDPHRQRAAVRHLGAVLEGSRNIYWRLTPLENLEYFGALRGLSLRTARERGLKLLDRFGLADRKDQPVRSFSRGMQQKVAIAVSVVHSPRLLLLDEPTLGLDVHAAEDVKRLIGEMASEGRSILLTTHHLSVAEEIADHVAVIRDGKLVVHGSMRGVLSEFSDSCYRIRFEGVLHPTQREQLSRMQIDLGGEGLLYQGRSEGLYDVLQILRPLEISSITRDQKSLTDVFLHLTRETTRA